MALENYIKPEDLCGDNLYSCSGCNQKVEATKGLKIDKCPPVLSLSLNRFTLDFETFQRVKINDKVTFPFLLNMNNYIHGYDNIQEKQTDIEIEKWNEEQKQLQEKEEQARLNRE